MGGSAVLMFSHLATNVLAFDPLVDPINDTRWDFRITTYRLPKAFRRYHQEKSFDNRIC